MYIYAHTEIRNVLKHINSTGIINSQLIDNITTITVFIIVVITTISSCRHKEVGHIEARMAHYTQIPSLVILLYLTGR